MERQHGARDGESPAGRSGAGKTNVPAAPLGSAGTKWGVGVRHALFPMLALGAHWLPASRRYSPRQAESSAS